MKYTACGKLLKLHELLIKPIQKICKYPLLIKELLKYTPSNISEYNTLNTALDRLEEIAKEINESKANAENMQKLLDIDKHLEGFNGKLAEEGRYLCMTGALQKVNPRGKVQTRYFFLVSDMLIWAKQKKIKKTYYEFKGSLRLDLAIVRDTPDTRNLKNKFQIIKLDTKKIYNLCAETPSLKKKWMSEIERLINIYLEIAKIDSLEKKQLKRDNEIANNNNSNSLSTKSEVFSPRYKSTSPKMKRFQTASFNSAMTNNQNSGPNLSLKSPNLARVAFQNNAKYKSKSDSKIIHDNNTGDIDLDLDEDEDDDDFCNYSNSNLNNELDIFNLNNNENITIESLLIEMKSMKDIILSNQKEISDLKNTISKLEKNSDRAKKSIRKLKKSSSKTSN
eukprot:TRINITY_DN7057_c0_g2_i1.p1 TRINITY_DN7057_c0_g2~~TRINITY_DN7057_c0_g2_i1.p1  ORF type:complete len:393 (-),score=105.17 TRINITY_DN7057_c0_g2_i1:35-1213(-)